MYLVINQESLEDLYRYALYSSDDRDLAVDAACDNANEGEELIVINAQVLYRQPRTAPVSYDEMHGIMAGIDYPYSHSLERERT